MNHFGEQAFIGIFNNLSGHLEIQRKPVIQILIGLTASDKDGALKDIMNAQELGVKVNPSYLQMLKNK